MPRLVGRFLRGWWAEKIAVFLLHFIKLTALFLVQDVRDLGLRVAQDVHAFHPQGSELLLRVRQDLMDLRFLYRIELQPFHQIELNPLRDNIWMGNDLTDDAAYHH